ncbi:zinc-binding dehydrogenase [Rhodobacteraceae bacterium W635]|uniref:Zn-dependent alcohol dehydrogenase n=1 Tax=Nioella halotolerans TaxID=2303578 RepID=UPI000E3B9AE5|nr:zinc-binding dehydrogenase [Rhodobacteraceae bacterium W635]
MTRVKAAVCHAYGAELTIEGIDLRAPGQGEVEVRLDAVAICHSDISFIDGAWGGDLPAVYGHEAAGRVTATGPGVTAYAPGDKVLVTLIKSCGSCGSCASGAPVYCSDTAPAEPAMRLADGTVVTKAMNCGAFAEAAIVHQSQLAPLPDDIPADVASLLACGVITGVGAVVNSAQVRPGQTVVVIGAGGVGLNAIQGARIAGAARIIAVDLSEEKLNDAKAFGATDGVLASVDKPWQEVERVTSGRKADAVFVTVGALPAYMQSLRFLARGGTMYAVGMPHSGATAEYEPVILAAVGQGIKGSKMGDAVLARDIPWMVDMYRQGRLKLDELISNRWRLDQINEAIADTKAGNARRNVIVLS